MPYVKVVERKRIKKHYGPMTGIHAKFLLLILLSSAVVGWMAIGVVSLFTSSPQSNITQLSREARAQIIEEYKTKYGNTWKDQLLADYKKN